MIAPELHELARAVYPLGRLLAVKELSGGVSARTVEMEIGLADTTTRLIARWANPDRLKRFPDAACSEFKTMQAAEAAGLAIARPLLLRDPCLVIEHVDGHPDLVAQDLESYLAQFVTHLVGIHRANPTPFHHLPSQAEYFSRKLATPPEKLDHALQEGLIRQALSAAWPAGQNPTALLHGDFWPGNLLWRDGRLVAVIDWEEAMLGDPLADLSICRLDTFWIFGAAAMERLTQLYGSSSSIDLRWLPLWDLVAALRPAGQLPSWAKVYPGFGRPDVTEQTMREVHHRFVAQALTAIDR
jgi:aminoglycoside phosphotransferase (APT) family kinase protein